MVKNERFKFKLYKCGLWRYYFPPLFSLEVLNEPGNLLAWYRQDSVVSDSINYDLLIAMDEIQNGSRDCPALLDHPPTKTKATIPAAIQNAERCSKPC